MHYLGHMYGSLNSDKVQLSERKSLPANEINIQHLMTILVQS